MSSVRFSVLTGLILALSASACASAASEGSEELLASIPPSNEPVHALVRFPPDATQSVLWEEGSGLLWAVPEDVVGEEGWHLVYLPPSYLDELAGIEGIEWRVASPGAVNRSIPVDALAARGVAGGVTPNFADGDTCAAPTTVTHANMFCPYDPTQVSAHSWVNCNRSIRAELEAAPMDYPAVSIGGVSTTYVQVLNLGTVGGQILRAVRVGRLYAGGAPVPQVVVYGGQHSREWATSETIMRNLRWFASSYRDNTNGVRALLADRAIVFIPVVNIQGYRRTHEGTTSAFRLWRPNFTSCGATPSGTDLNRNAPLSYGQPGSGASCTTSESSTFRGPIPAGSQVETVALLNAFANPTQYRTVLSVNTHAYGNLLLFTEGLSASFSPCTTDSNCTAPDLGLFYDLAGTERAPRMRDEEIPTVPYRTAQTTRALYAVSGDTVTETVYGTLPSSTPRFVSIASEISYTACGFYAERIPASQLTNLANNYRAFEQHLLGQADELASSTVPAFHLPLVHRRQASGGGAEFPVWRIAARSTLAGYSLSPVGGGTGTASVDDVRDGVFYREHRYTPGTPYHIPSRMISCATGVNCRTASIDGSTGTVNLCDPNRLTTGGGWAFQGDVSGGPQNECFWRFDRTGTAPWLLTSTTRNLQFMGSSRLVFSYRWSRSRVTGRVEVSANGFAGCSDTNFGNCRIVDRFDGNYGGVYDLRDNAYKTAIYDISDFDGKNNVQVRFVVDTATSPAAAADWDVYDPVFVGWYTGP
ncbi:MAG: hypothetical protein J0L92_03430 [Deltaproteobacteria bacterium]|nr:hypothetical protein [Deltaproteobacteria bacterium]